MTENLLGLETSPYLLQHRDNPVHWRSWGEATLAEAARLDRPILLSVGYAACHWCHVMAHESFEDPATAAVMNELFVNIKVDREERPDIDQIYQYALALMGEQGGWPLTMFLTPKGEPFWGGTYFPPEPRYGRPGFRDLLRRVAEIYTEEKATVAQNVEALRQGLGRLARDTPGAPVTIADLDRAAEQFLRLVDPQEGGIDGAPKFPQTPIFKLLWRAFKRTGKAEYRTAVLATLGHMSQGGIYDHLGGGFARYSTDSHWLVPHFEKMLYDNAQLLEQLCDAWLDTRDALFAARAEETVGWLLREMIGEGGAFASTQDADSEGEEGKFFVWSEAEIDALLGAESAFFKAAYDVRPEGNWEGHNILNRIGRGGLAAPEEEARLARARATLFAAREKRIKPGRDDKLLADWNGLMIAALARAALVFDKPNWLAAAERAFVFVRDEMTREGRLHHSYRQGQLKHKGSLDDYAAAISAALMLQEATGNAAYLEDARRWLDALDRHYWDAAGGGYFFTADDVTDVIARAKSAQDNATPSGNGMMVAALARLHYLTGEEAHRTRAEAILGAFSGAIEKNIFGLATLLNAAELLQRAQQLVLVGDPASAAFNPHARAAYDQSAPNLIVARVPPGASLPEGHPAHGKTAGAHDAAAYLCTGQTCSLPIAAPNGLKAALAAVR